MTYFLGIDGGGTKTLFRLTDESGKVLLEQRDGGMNPNTVGIDRSLRILQENLDRIVRTYPAAEISVFAGIAGAGSPHYRETYRKKLAEYSFLCFDAGSDAENVIAAGLQGNDGIILILGTGIACFRVQNSTRTRIGGWGYLLDAGGSAWHLGRDALQACYAMADHTGPDTLLQTLIESFSGLSGDALLKEVYNREPAFPASFAPLVFEAAEKNDPAAVQILENNTAAVLRILRTALSPFDHPVPVIAAGGLTAQNAWMERIRSELPKEQQECFSVLAEEPVNGALCRARELWREKRHDTEL